MCWGGGERVMIVEVVTFSVILRNSELVTIYRKYDEIYILTTVLLNVQVVCDVTMYSPAMPYHEKRREPPA
jgi:hypothetical protein